MKESETRLVTWAARVEATGLCTPDALYDLSREYRYPELQREDMCERIEMERHFIFDELVINYRKWGYPSLGIAISEYVDKFHASRATRDAAYAAVMQTFKMKGESP
jgi:hypothetical protein